MLSKNSRFFFVKVKKIAGSLWPLVSSSSSQYPSLHCNLHLGAVPSKTRMYQKKYMASESGHKLQGVSKKRYFSDFLSYFSSRGRILLFHMCFGIRILSPFHLAIQKVSIQNLNCPKNAKNACADMIFIPAFCKCFSANDIHALDHFRFPKPYFSE